MDKGSCRHVEEVIVHYMLSNRSYSPAKGFGTAHGTLGFFACEGESAVTDHRAWQRLSEAEFYKAMLEEASRFPYVDEDRNELQKHLSLFVHGYNTDWEQSVRRYNAIDQAIYSGPEGLGRLVLFSWPSKGSVAGYLPDRAEAEASAEQLIPLLVKLHDHMVRMQRRAVGPEELDALCRAKVSIIGHSMGCYLLQKSLAKAALRLNNPDRISLINQLVLVAADIDNDLFQKAKPLDSDGSLMSNLSYRICALWSGLDQTLGVSAGLKHFGTRRLGRSGLANPAKVWDNVFGVDVSSIVAGEPSAHSGVFTSAEGLSLLRDTLQGIDRHHLPSAMQTSPPQGTPGNLAAA